MVNQCGIQYKLWLYIPCLILGMITALHPDKCQITPIGHLTVSLWFLIISFVGIIGCTIDTMCYNMLLKGLPHSLLLKNVAKVVTHYTNSILIVFNIIMWILDWVLISRDNSNKCISKSASMNIMTAMVGLTPVLF